MCVEIPTIENADAFVDRLVRAGIVERNELVDLDRSRAIPRR